MVRPGVTTRNPLVNRRLLGCRTALMVCQAMTIAMTVVLPAPVASFRAIRSSSGLASWFTSASRSNALLSAALSLGTTSVSQMRVSTASTWQKKRPIVAEVVLSPMQEQPRGFRRNAPVVRTGNVSPPVNVAPDLVHRRGNVVLLLLS